MTVEATTVKVPYWVEDYSPELGAGHCTSCFSNLLAANDFKPTEPYNPDDPSQERCYLCGGGGY